MNNNTFEPSASATAILAKMKYAVRVIGDMPMLDFWGMRAWCRSEFGDAMITFFGASGAYDINSDAAWDTTLDGIGRCFRFEREADAILFKLKFGGDHDLA